jgi:hypothetical protein
MVCRGCYHLCTPRWYGVYLGGGIGVLWCIPSIIPYAMGVCIGACGAKCTPVWILRILSNTPCIGGVHSVLEVVSGGGVTSTGGIVMYCGSHSTCLGVVL